MPKSLIKSHLMPAALYGIRKRDFEIITATGTLKTQVQMKQPLLCRDCEGRFDKGGESHVLEMIAPKSRRAFPLHDRMRIAYPRDSDPSISRFYGPDFGLDMDKFAYFAISVVWRLAATQWEMQDNSQTRPLNLGSFQENMRRYLLGETPLPSDMAVIVIVCNDAKSRETFFLPCRSVEAGCLNFRFLARGIFFRVLVGYQMWPSLKEASCTSRFKCIWYGDGERRTLEALG